MSTKSRSTRNPMTEGLRNRSGTQTSATPRTVIGLDPEEEQDPYHRGGGTTHWAAASAMAPISFGENAILNGIERKELADEAQPATRGRSGTRARSGTVAQELHVRTRKASLESITMETAHMFADGRSKFRRLFNFIEAIVPRLYHRVQTYISVLFVICLLALSKYYDDPGAWFSLFFSVIGIDMATAIVDQVIFIYFIDKIFVNHFEIAYLLHGFNGPLGMLLAVLIIGSALRHFSATQAVPNWDRLVSLLAVIVLCMCVKNWYSRRHYIRLLERRFSVKLFKLQSWTVLLSELASYRHKKRSRGPGSEVSHTDSVGRISIENYIPGLEALHKTFVDVFADLVDATSKYSDEFEEDVDLLGTLRNNANLVGNNGGAGGGGGNPKSVQSNDEDSQKPSSPTANWRSEIRKKRTFWELAATMSMNSGALLIYTYNGRVTVRRKFQAKSFGKSLFLHLSRGGKDVVTHDMLRDIIQQRCNIDSSEQNPDAFGDEEAFGRQREKDFRAISVLKQKSNVDYATFLYEASLELLDPFRLGYITEEQCMAALCLVYKEQRFAASSLNDYGELHQSLRHVGDTFFWTLMVFFIQAFLGWNVIEYILPFLTLILTLSFALSSLVGNLFLSISFVFFMQPFEVGNKIAIGPEGSSRVVGYVTSISLLHTTVNTFYNELVKIPNHTLYSEKIINYAESGGVTYALDLSFNLSDDRRAMQAKIDEFFERLKTWVLIENKMDWQSCLSFSTGIHSKDDAVNYMLWVTHRDCWQDTLKPLLARTALVRYIKSLQAELGLSFISIRQPIEMVKDNDEEFYGHFDRQRSMSQDRFDEPPAGTPTRTSMLKSQQPLPQQSPTMYAKTIVPQMALPSKQSTDNTSAAASASNQSQQQQQQQQQPRSTQAPVTSTATLPRPPVLSTSSPEQAPLSVSTKPPTPSHTGNIGFNSSSKETSGIATSPKKAQQQQQQQILGTTINTSSGSFLMSRNSSSKHTRLHTTADDDDSDEDDHMHLLSSGVIGN